MQSDQYRTQPMHTIVLHGRCCGVHLRLGMASKLDRYADDVLRPRILPPPAFTVRVPHDHRRGTWNMHDLTTG